MSGVGDCWEMDDGKSCKMMIALMVCGVMTPVEKFRWTGESPKKGWSHVSCCKAVVSSSRQYPEKGQSFIRGELYGVSLTAREPYSRARARNWHSSTQR